MAQITDRSIEQSGKNTITRHGRLLTLVDKTMPWPQLERTVRECYPKAGKGRRPYEPSVMLRIHVLQILFNHSDPGMQHELLETRSMRRFAGLGETDKVPDESTILRFRHRLKEHGLGKKVQETVIRHLARQGIEEPLHKS